MAFRKKSKLILEFAPDLAIVPESESPTKLKFPKLITEPRDKIWVGENSSKGLSIFSYSDLEITLHESYDPEYKYIVPIQVSGKEHFNLIAVWAMNDTEKRSQRYIGQAWLALQRYEPLLGDSVLIAGDFNWNKVWDGSHNLAGNLTKLVKYLKTKGIKSLYHHYFQENFGQETQPTFYMYRKIEKPYHIDYCFGSTDFVDRLQFVKVGKYKTWHEWSDHTPVFCSFSSRDINSQISL
ncbi:MAG: endonuclease/exonuclease/phosphatase family protein [Chloroflexota bacterium]|nr:endonuclease/exonuclease/phosphatase family protein [Chloroflexota bacterium]